MGIRFGTNNPGSNLRIGTETVGGIAIGNEVAWRASQTAATTNYLYMYDVISGRLYRMNVTTGIPISNGVRVRAMQGLTFHNGTMYGIGRSPNGFLYSIDTATGFATQVSRASGEGIPNALAFHNGAFYIIGRATWTLRTINISTGTSTQVGSATRFGINEVVPSGLVSHNGSLYMVGTTNGALFTLNTTTGIATRVGNSNKFGVNENSPTGLGSHNGNLYMCGSTNNALYTLNTTTGVATQVGSATRFGINLSGPSGLTGAAVTADQIEPNPVPPVRYNPQQPLDPLPDPPMPDPDPPDPDQPDPDPPRTPTRDLYMISSSRLYVVDATTGLATRQGSSSIGISPNDLANISGSLYTLSGTTLYRISTSTGRATRVGSSSNSDLQSTMSSTLIPGDSVVSVTADTLTAHSRSLYSTMRVSVRNSTLGTSRTLSRLVVINRSTGRATSSRQILAGSSISAIVVGGGLTNVSFDVLVSHSGSLYGVDGGRLYRFSGDYAIRGSSITTPGGMASRGGTLYGAYSNGLYSISTSSGSRTRIGSGYGLSASPRGLTSV